MDLPDVAGQTTITIGPPHKLSKEDDRESTEVQHIYISDEGPHKSVTKHARVPPPIRQKQEPPDEPQDHALLTNDPQS